MKPKTSHLFVLLIGAVIVLSGWIMAENMQRPGGYRADGIWHSR